MLIIIIIIILLIIITILHVSYLLELVADHVEPLRIERHAEEVLSVGGLGLGEPEGGGLLGGGELRGGVR